MNRVPGIAHGVSSGRLKHMQLGRFLVKFLRLGVCEALGVVLDGGIVGFHSGLAQGCDVCLVDPPFPPPLSPASLPSPRLYTMGVFLLYHLTNEQTQLRSARGIRRRRCSHNSAFSRELFFGRQKLSAQVRLRFRRAISTRSARSASGCMLVCFFLFVGRNKGQTPPRARYYGTAAVARVSLHVLGGRYFPWSTAYGVERSAHTRARLDVLGAVRVHK